MPTYAQHLEKYEHNKRFCQFGISNIHDNFIDWEITAHFYAAVHLIEAIIEQQLHAHSENHADRWNAMSSHRELFSAECATDYVTLKALATKARYEVLPLSKKEAVKAQNCIEDMSIECKKYLT